MRTCPKCGKQLPEEAKFCLECGADLSGKGSASRRKVILLSAIVAAVVLAIVVVLVFLLRPMEKPQETVQSPMGDLVEDGAQETEAVSEKPEDFEELYDGDGNLIGVNYLDEDGQVVAHEIVENGQLVRCEWYAQSQLTQIDYYENEALSYTELYENGQLSSVNRYDSLGNLTQCQWYEAGTLTGSCEYTYDGDGNLLSFVDYTAEGQPTNSMTRTYEDGVCTGQQWYDGSGQLYSQDYFDGQENIIRNEWYQDGRVINYTEHVYASTGQCQESRSYDETGQLVYAMYYSEDGQLIRDESYLSGVLSARTDYEYGDGMDQPYTVMRTYNGRDVLQSAYFFREGAPVGWAEYDENGAVINCDGTDEQGNGLKIG